MIFDQAEYQVRCDWGVRGLRELAPISEVVIILDVLSFTTSVEIAATRGGIIYPFPLKGESASEYAATVGANLASADRAVGFSLSPASLVNLPHGYRLVLPSPNGAAASFAADHRNVLAACLRNARATAKAAASLGSTFAIIPAGETWDTGELRPSLEDLIGAGAVIHALAGTRSPEAELAVAAFRCFQDQLLGTLQTCSSGKELIERGFASEVNLAAELNVSDCVPILTNRAFINRASDC